MNINFIECTLRDGGYHNNWDFSEKLVIDYLKTMELLKFKNIEFGFRFNQTEYWMGDFAYTTENTIQKFKPKKFFNIGVMINCSDFINNNKIDIESLHNIFPLNSKTSRLDFVRVATHIKDFEFSAEISNFLSKKGYKTAINIMQSHNLNKKLINEFSEISNELNLSSLYFADSLGCLEPSDVREMVQDFKEFYNGDVGIHAHDNMGFALINSIEAVINGATWIDSTITGMGRGPGNTRTEEILLYYFQNSSIKNKTKIVDLIDNHFSKLKNTYKWGSSPFYFLSAINKVHPSYIQEMETDKSINNFDKISFLENVNENISQSFSPEVREKINNFYLKRNRKDNLENLFKKKNYIILGAGSTIQKYKTDIELFITKNDLTVIQLNNNPIISENLIDYFVISHPQKFFPANLSKNSKRKYIVPSVKDFEVSPSKNIYKYDIEIEENSFNSYKLYTKIPNGLALTFSLGILEKNKFSKNIYLAGIDGYKENLYKNTELNSTLSLFQKNFQKTNLVSITPSKLDIIQKNINSF